MVIILTSSTHFTENIYAVLRQKMIKRKMMGALCRRGQKDPRLTKSRTPASWRPAPASRIVPMPKRKAEGNAPGSKAKAKFCKFIC